MNYTIRYYILFFLLPVFSCVFAQQMSVTTLPLNNYLPSSSVLRVHCDKEGFLWLGTKDGLCRYDAYRIQTFRSGLKTPNLLTNNEITCIAEDDKGFLYIGRFFVKFGGNLFFISTVSLFFFLNPIKSCRYVCFLVTLKTPHH